MNIIPQDLIDFWKEHPAPIATTADIITIEASVGSKLPPPYYEFVTQVGFALFGYEQRYGCFFNYTLNLAGQKNIYEGNISNLRNPDRLIIAYQNCTIPDPADDSTPFFPK